MSARKGMSDESQPVPSSSQPSPDSSSESNDRMTKSPFAVAVADLARQSLFAVLSSRTRRARSRLSPCVRQVEDRVPLPPSTAAADRDHLVSLGQVDPLDRHRHAEHLGLERQREVILDHGEESTALLRLVVGIDDRLLDEPLEMSPARWPAAVPLLL